MNLEKAVEVLKEFNEWRSEKPPYNKSGTGLKWSAGEIGDAIDVACEVMSHAGSASNTEKIRTALCLAMDYLQNFKLNETAFSELDKALKDPARNCDVYGGAIQATMAFNSQKGKLPDPETMSWCFASHKEG